MRSIRRSAIVAHAPPALYAIIGDIEAYPSFLPWCLAARVLEREIGSLTATLEVGYRGIRRSFTTRNVNRPPEAIDMQLVEGPFSAFSAGWSFTELGPAASKIEFRMDYDFASAALATLLEPLFAHVADTMVDAFTRRADALHGDAAG
jgi:ribosome-associated toxin RatA of RatAB toxin-antitoxin module